MKTYFVEAFGTFTLSLVVALSLAGMFPVSTPVLAALTLALFVYTTSHVAGTHINPAVTIGMWSLGKIDSREATGYVISQFLGAAAAFFLAQYFIPSLSYFHAQPGTFSTAVAEGIGTLFFTFGIAAVTFGKVSDELKGFVIGGSLLLGESIAFFAGSSGILNPAVALAVNSFNVMYLIGPIVGAVIGMWIYKLFATGTR
jgi:aquaporin Z